MSLFYLNIYIRSQKWTFFFESSHMRVIWKSYMRYATLELRTHISYEIIYMIYVRVFKEVKDRAHDPWSRSQGSTFSQAYGPKQTGMSLRCLVFGFPALFSPSLRKLWGFSTTLKSVINVQTWMSVEILPINRLCRKLLPNFMSGLLI